MRTLGIKYKLKTGNGLIYFVPVLDGFSADMTPIKLNQ